MRGDPSRTVHADDGIRGGYRCPVAWCDFTAVVEVLLKDHLRWHHTEEERNAAT